jgi:hypothetical protein
MTGADLTIATDVQPPSRLWWLYFGVLVAFGILGAVPFVLGLGQQPWRMLVLGAAATILNVWGIVGLWGYIRSRPLGFSDLWKACTLLTAVQIAFSAFQFSKVLTSGAQGTERLVAIVGLCSMAFAVPLLIALGRYAFRSPGIWRS